jgi:hypothetical protein
MKGWRPGSVTAYRQDGSLHEPVIKAQPPTGGPRMSRELILYREQKHANNRRIHYGFKAL